MKRRTWARIGISLLAVVVLALGSLAFALSHESPCGDAEPLAPGTQRMQAIVQHCYGSSDVLALEEIARPAPADHEVLVKVHAAGLNPLDWHYMTGTPYIMRMSAGLGAPESTRVGVDFAGTVAAVGRNVTRFKPGDEVFGGRSGAFAEYVTIGEERALALKPANLDFERAAVVAIAGTTALQALRDKGRLQRGQKVLINGASGGVGTFAVQIAKAMGAEVTGVCSTRNVELVRSLGADHVVDYKQQDFTEGSERYDLILDNVGNHPLSALRRALQPDGIVVMVGGPKSDPWLGPMARPLKAAVVAPFVSQNFEMLMAELRASDLQVLGALMGEGKVTPVIDRAYALAEVPEAVRYLATGRARGKVVVHVAMDPQAIAGGALPPR